MIELQLLNGGVGQQLMCSKRMMTRDFGEVIAESLNLTKFFTSKSLNVQRIKIETSLTNKLRMSLNKYYEVHVPVVIEREEDKELLTDFLDQWHISSNAFKTVSAGRVFFMTWRGTWPPALEAALFTLTQYLQTTNIKIDEDKIEKECVLVDTLESLDAEWIRYE